MYIPFLTVFLLTALGVNIMMWLKYSSISNAKYFLNHPTLGVCVFFMLGCESVYSELCLVIGFEKFSS